MFRIISDLFVSRSKALSDWSVKWLRYPYTKEYIAEQHKASQQGVIFALKPGEACEALRHDARCIKRKLANKLFLFHKRDAKRSKKVACDCMLWIGNLGIFEQRSVYRSIRTFWHLPMESLKFSVSVATFCTC